MEKKVFSTKDELCKSAAQKLAEIGKAAIAKDGQFTLVLSGGKTPEALYALLAQEPYRDELDWKKVHLFWGDERCVVKTHPDSNYRMANESLISKVSIPAGNVHRIGAEEDAMLAAQQYEDELRDFFGVYEAGFPSFDLILLGLGDDGHTASLFPETEALGNNERWVVDNFVKKLHAHRITMTFPTINHAANVMFLVSGSSKASVCKQIFAGSGQFPAQKVQPVQGTLAWYLDKDANT